MALSRTLAALAAGAVVALSWTQDVRAQAPAWPTKPVKLIVPFAPGAGADIGARLAADALSRKWNQSVVVENRPGGDSLIAIRAVVGENDDHQFLFTPTGNFTPHPYRHEKLGYVRERDLLPIARFSNTILAVGVSEQLGVKTLQEFVELARKRPGELNVMTVPGITDVVWDNFTTELGLKFQKVNFNNLGQGAAEMAAGRIQAVMSAYAVMQPVIGNGARVLAVNSRTRAPALPNVPTAIEAGVPSLQLEGLVGMFGPRSVSAALRKRIGEEVAEVARMPQIAEKLVASAQVPNPGGAEEFEKDIAEQERQVAEIAKRIGLTRKD
jgi:tripartite-type tricarboxylate transporter receptor subunit TctC